MERYVTPDHRPFCLSQTAAKEPARVHVRKGGCLVEPLFPSAYTSI